jgi:hypothetical protein
MIWSQRRRDGSVIYLCAECRKKPRNARFWITRWRPTPEGYGDARELTFVKVTIKPGEFIEEYESGRTEEGWHSEATIWTNDGTHVVREYTSCGSDCDGRLDRYGVDQCPLDELREEKPYHCDDPSIRMPRWQDREESQRDYSAEAMGY